MNPRIQKVKPLNDYTLYLTFKNGEKKIFDLKPYLHKGVFKSLNNPVLFATARVEYGTVVWQNDLDFDPDTLYLESTPLQADLISND